MFGKCQTPSNQAIGGKKLFLRASIFVRNLVLNIKIHDNLTVK